MLRVVVALAAAVCGLVASAPAQQPVPTSPTPVGATALLSVRRVSAWVDDTVAAARLRAELAPDLAPLGPAAPTSCLEVSLLGRPIDTVNGALPVEPASNEKLLTATAALDRLGPGYRYTTSVLSSTPAVGGVVHGDLYLVGGGDPVLRTPQYEARIPDGAGPYTSLPQLAAQVRAAGITGVTGTVVGDGTRYDDLVTVSGWKPEYAADGDVGPLSGLDVDDGFHLTPDNGYTGDADPARAAAADLATLLVGDGVTIAAAVPPPPGTAAAAVPAALDAAEGAASTAAASGVAPAGASVVTDIASAPLSAILDAVLAPSDDTAAEEITKELGRVTSGMGSTAAGTDAIRADLAADGLPLAGVTIGDGSGLDPSDRVTCALVGALLARAEATRSPLVGDLAVGGRTGTLAHRLTTAPTVGRVLAKTGTLHGVSALSGVVLPAAGPGHPPLTFSLIMNGVGEVSGLDIGAAVATSLATAPGPPQGTGPIG